MFLKNGWCINPGCFGLMAVMATGFIPLSPMYMYIVPKAASGLERIQCREAMGRCTGRLDITEITLKTAFNTI